MPDDPIRPGEPPRDISGDPLPPPRPLPNNPLPDDPPPNSPPPLPSRGAQQYVQPGGRPDEQSYDLSGDPLPPAAGAPPMGQSPYYTAPSGGPPPAWPPPPGSAYGQPQGPYAQPMYYPVQVNGSQILTMGIVSFFCFGIILGPMAYFQGNSALAAIDRGEADPFQRGNVSAGRICGLISGILSAITLVGYLIYFIVVFAAIILGGSHG